MRRLRGSSGAVAAALAACAALAPVTNAYQDAGSTPLAPWPPLRAKPNPTSIATAVVAPCNLTIEHRLAGDAAVAAELYAAVLAGMDPGCTADPSRATLTTLVLTVTEGGVPDPLTADVDESFELVVTAASAQARAATYVGALRALETFSQLIVRSGGGGSDGAAVFVVPQCPWQIYEHPSMEHRGLLLDPARTFIPLGLLKATVDAMMYSKMNVLHLHLTDSQSIPLELPSLPAVSRAAPYSADEVYSVADIEDLVEYARLRGVRVLPEIDTPGHARAWGLADGFSSVVACGEVSGEDYATYCAEPPCGQLNPAAADNLTYTVVESATRDVADAFGGERIHLGYDEVNFACWEDDAAAAQHMAHKNIDAPGLLREYYTEQRRRFDANHNTTKAAFWEEVALQRLPLRGDDLVQVWSDPSALRAVLDGSDAGVVVSWAHSYYLDCGRGNMFGGRSWCDPYKTAVDVYAANPLDGFGEGEVHRAAGGEALLWGELVSPDAVMSLAWPRAAAYGARLWNNDVVANASAAVVALQAHADRLRARGVAADRVTTRSCVLRPDLCFGSEPVAAPPPPSSPSGHPFHTQAGAMTAVVVIVGALLAVGVVTALVVWRRNERARAGLRRRRQPRVINAAGTRPLLPSSTESDFSLSPSPLSPHDHWGANSYTDI